MATLYVEPFSGISGNMFLGALMDAGLPFDFLEKELTKLELGNYKLIYEKVEKCGISATHFDVELTDVVHTHTFAEENMSQEHSHAHAHEHVHHKQPDQLATEVMHQHTHVHRNLTDIVKIIKASTITDKVKENAIQVFTELAKAEAKVHGKSIEEIHFHEVGAIDTIIDIVGSCLALDYLKIEKIYVGRMQTGRGFIKCAHGLMPVPAPATAELLKALPHYQGEIEKELVTPTGAALMGTLAEVSSELPAQTNQLVIGYGAGTWDLPIPNVLRIYLDKNSTFQQPQEQLIVAECNIDDSTGEIFPYLLNKVLGQGALDAWITPIIMKKGRPAQKLSVLCKETLLADISDIIFKETSTLGVRYYPVKRKILARDFITVTLPEGKVKVKYATLNGEVVNIAPEYADCQQIANISKKPLKTIMNIAQAKGREMLHAKL